MKYRGLFFTKTNARVLNGEAVDPRIVNLVINPDLSLTNGTPPHYWCFKEGKIVSMGSDEKAHRDALIQEFGIINDPVLLDEVEEKKEFEEKQPEKITKVYLFKTLLLVSAVCFVVGLLIGLFGGKYV